MVVVGVVLTFVGAVLFILSLAFTIHANPDRRVPYWSSPTPVPKHSAWTRVIAVLLIIPSGALVGWENMNWLFPFYGVVIFLGIMIITTHNSRVKSRS